MGIDFSLVAVKNTGGKWVQVGGKSVPHSWFRHHLLDTIFSKMRRRMNKLVGRRLFFEFYDHTNSTGLNGEGENIHFEPQQVLETVSLLKGALKKYHRELPHFYWFHVPGDAFEAGSADVFIDNVQARLDGDWDSCLMIWGFGEGKELKRKDISHMRRISCNRLTYEKKGGAWVPIMGEEIVVKVEKQPMYKFYAAPLNKMIRVCTYAKKRGYHVQGRLL